MYVLGRGDFDQTQLFFMALGPSASVPDTITMVYLKKLCDHSLILTSAHFFVNKVNFKNTYLLKICANNLAKAYLYMARFRIQVL